MKKRLCLFFALALAAHVAFSQTVDEYLNIGEKYFLEGRVHEAQSAIEEAIRLDPNNARSHCQLGVIYFFLNENTLALGSFSRAIELDNTIAEAYFSRAHIYAGTLNDHAKALSDYNMAVYLEPENDRYRINRGNLLIVTGDSLSALIDFNRAVEIDPLNYINFQQRGNFYTMHGHYEMALDDFNTAIRLNSDDVKNFSNKGVALFMLERYEEAVENFNIVLRLDSNDAGAYSGRGHAHFKLGMYNEAVLDFTEVISRINPNSGDYRTAYLNRAVTYRLLANQTDDPVQARYYRTRAQIDEDIVARLDGKRE